MFERCKKADILEKSGELLCRARVNVGRSGDILMIIPTAAAYKPNALYHVIFYDPVNGLVTCKCRLSTAVTLPGGDLCSLRCEVQDRLASRQRRQDVKVKVQINIMIHPTAMPGDTFRVPELGYPATIDNISAGGVYLRTGLPLEPGRRLWFNLRQTGEELTLSAQVLRTEKAACAPGSGKMFGYGCKFVNLLTRQETLLRSFVFQEERRLRQQERGR
ncbi:MAG: PilZ domain-containing protein [Oscillospiraceae bacterium]|jgi:hypothetical protein|nr:PilZ domain-containing protein [Oscillospiraceae bacterium]